MIELRSVSKEFSFHDESGYSFTVTAAYDPEWGWEASVSMVTRGHKECDGAVHHLRHAAEAFLRQLGDEGAK